MLVHQSMKYTCLKVFPSLHSDTHLIKPVSRALENKLIINHLQSRQIGKLSSRWVTFIHLNGFNNTALKT